MALASLSATGINQSTIRGPRGVFVPQTRTVEILDEFVTTSFSATPGAATWDTDLTGGGTITHGDAHGGTCVIATDSGNDDETKMEMNSEWILPAATKRLMFETRLSMTTADITTTELFVGLLVAGTVIGNNAATIQTVDHAGFWCENAASILCGYGIDDDVEVDTGVDLVTTEMVTLGFEYGPHLAADTWKFYVNGNLVTTQTDTRIPAENMTVFVGHRNGTGAVHTTTVEYVYILADL